MIQVSGAGKRYGHKMLFQEVDWLVTPQDRVGLVGANGTGKSTILKMLAGLETPDYGAITVARGTTAGYLPQDGLNLSGRTVFEECLAVFADLREMEQELGALTHSMAELDPASAEYAQVADRFHRIEHEFRARDGYALEAQAGAVLSGLGFGPTDWKRRTEEFSGGWQMRIALAKLLLQKPNLLLLDEPTNHLDLETRNWLEEYLSSYPYAYVLISHDRYFLDVTVKKIAEIWNQQVHFYAGNYDKYLESKDQRRTQLEAAHRNQQERVKQLEAFINRFRYQATKAKQVQSRIKELERIERIEIPPEEKTIHFTFPQPPASGRTVAEFQHIAKSYGEKEVFRSADFVIERGERVALVGPNGAGKSTLIKLLAGLERPTGGEYKLGHKVEVDYFAQDQYKELDTAARVLDDIGKVAPYRTDTELRNLLGCFLFTADDAFKTIGVLSGGERNRYALARMLLHPSNFLLLDEPTNHLDLRAKDVLLEALQKFSGTVVFVSHDRYFIDKLATRIFEVGGGEVRVYPGNYEDYRWRKEREAQEGGAGAPPDSRPPQLLRAGDPGRGRLSPQVPEPTLADAPKNGDETAAKKRINPIKLRQMEARQQEIEEEVTRLEAAVAECEQALTRFVSAAETARVTAELEKNRAELVKLMGEWEEVAQAIEQST